MAGDRVSRQPKALVPALVSGLVSGLSLALAGSTAGWLVPPAGADQGDMVNPIEARPPGLVVLWERAGRGGQEAVGVFAVSKDPNDPEVRQIKVWLELPNSLRVRKESIRCSLSQPMRMSSNGREFILRELNPGGTITSANRLDHQIWWAACYPEQAGKDPARLAGLARKLGYSGHLVEREQVLPGNTR
ncbi:MAG: hypothetical protein NTZ53_14160 [Cyanobacteria bacterium]|nr:hypothetical protein [Cyanobacteriota bacterium]